jgi:hypothetical protein
MKVIHERMGFEWILEKGRDGSKVVLKEDEMDTLL